MIRNSSLSTSRRRLEGSLRSNSNARPFCKDSTRTLALALPPTFLLSCCSFSASCSRRLKSTDNSATIEFTTSRPDKSFWTSLRASVHFALSSTGEHSAIRTRHGNNGRTSVSFSCESSLTLTERIAWKARVEGISDNTILAVPVLQKVFSKLKNGNGRRVAATDN